MGIFDFFSASPGKQAAQQGYQSQKSGIDYGKKATTTAQAKAVGALTAGGAEAEAAYLRSQGLSEAAINAGRDQGLGFIDQGTGQAADAYGNALDRYGELWPGAVSGYNAYGDFYGLGGEEGFDRAQANWLASPQYQAMVGESSLGQQSLDRSAAARGNPYNATDVLQYQGQLAGQRIGDYIGGLRPYLDIAPQMAGAQSNIYGNLANLYNQAGVNKANIATGAGGQLADVYGTTGGRLGASALGTGEDLATVYGNTGQQLAGLGTQQGQAGYNLAANNAQATYGAGQNIWNTVLGLANAGGRVAGAYA